MVMLAGSLIPSPFLLLLLLVLVLLVLLFLLLLLLLLLLTPPLVLIIILSLASCRYAAMAAKWKEPPKDALDTLVINAVDMPSMDKVTQTAFMPFDPVVKRTEGTVAERGKAFRTTKGAPHIILGLCKDAAVKARVEADVQVDQLFFRLFFRLFCVCVGGQI